MGAPTRRLCLISTLAPVICLVLEIVVPHEAARAINIVIDYRYDTNNFFSTQQRKDALQAAADRYSAIITTSLSSETMTDGSVDPRIGFTHPGTGASFQVSAANSAATDAISPAANEYRGTWTIPQDQWILYAGGRDITSAGVGGTGTGTNFTAAVFNDNNSHLNRGFRSSSQFGNLPVWGGAITFDTVGINWHFNLNAPASGSSLDFYSIALHEIGHALGLSASNWIDWNTHTSGAQFAGPNAVAAYESDSGANISSLNMESGINQHWEDGAYDSKIFNAGSPNYVGTVGPGNPQDLLMEPTANFTGSLRRFELTNVDVGALQDIGWDVIPMLELLDGDYNSDGVVDAADYVVWRKGGAPGGTYASWRANFGESLNGTGSGSSGGAVPEPAAAVLAALAVILRFSMCTRRAGSSLRQFG